MRNQLLSELNQNVRDTGVRALIQKSNRESKLNKKREAFEAHRKKMLNQFSKFSKESDRKHCTFTPRIKEYKPPSRPLTPQKEPSETSRESSKKLTLEDLDQTDYSPYKADSPTKHKLTLSRSQKSARSLYNFDVDNRSIVDLQEWHELKQARPIEKKLRKLGKKRTFF